MEENDNLKRVSEILEEAYESLQNAENNASHSSVFSLARSVRRLLYCVEYLAEEVSLLKKELKGKENV